METDTRTVVERTTRDALREPALYAVIMLNDDITTMDFVVELLVRVFHKTPAEASAVMMDIHQNGQGVAGVYTFDIAITKKAQADQMSAEKGFPLRLNVQEAG